MFVALAGCVFATLLLSGCSPVNITGAATAAKTATISGKVHGGQQPVAAATIQLFMVGTTGDGSAATSILTLPVTTSDGTGLANSNANAGNMLNTLPVGFFNITNDYVCPAADALVYIVARGGNPGFGTATNNTGLAMMAALGSCKALKSTPNIFIDELTTVGSIAALAPYMTSYAAVGSGSADTSQLANAFANVNQYTNTATGAVPGPALPASTYASSIEIDTLADAIATCINTTGATTGSPQPPCGALFQDATPSGGAAPTDTIGAVLNIVLNPNLNVCPIFGLVTSATPYNPTLMACPANWSLPISPLAVTVSGSSSVYVSQTAQFSATVTGATNQGVTWIVNGVSGGNAAVGTISSTGLYTAPSTPPSSAVSVTAVSILSSTATGSVSVTVLPVMVTVGGPANVLFGQTGQYSATVTGVSSQGVTWTVNGTAGGSTAQGTITTAGLYTAPASAPPTPVVIGAQSTAANASGSVSITVSSIALSYATGDTRTVTQPSNPAVCTTLTAQFTTSQRSSPPTAASDDTSRIQTALNSTACKNTGKAVELAVSGSNNAFFSELITLNGEGLTVDSGVTLYGGASYSTQSELILIKGANSSLTGPGIVDGRGDLYVGAGSSTRLVEATPTSNLIIYNVTLQQSIYPNLYIQGGNGSTVWGVSILTPASRANADGIDLDSLTNVTVTNSIIEAGDDGVAVKTNAGASSNVTVTNNKLYGTHGLSIGSIGGQTVTNILFLNNYVYGNDLQGTPSPSSNGLVVKIDPSCTATVQQVTYQNTCVTQVKHIVTFYTNYSGTCQVGAGNPVYSNIIVNGLYSTAAPQGAYSQFNGWSAAAPSNAALAYVSLDATALGGSLATQYTAIALDQSNLVPTGTGVTTSTFSTPGSVPSCTF